MTFIYVFDDRDLKVVSELIGKYTESIPKHLSIINSAFDLCTYICTCFRTFYFVIKSVIIETINPATVKNDVRSLLYNFLIKKCNFRIFALVIIKINFYRRT